jgi:hypothetical protein
MQVLTLTAFPPPWHGSEDRRSEGLRLRLRAIVDSGDEPHSPSGNVSCALCRQTSQTWRPLGLRYRSLRLPKGLGVPFRTATKTYLE